MHWPQNCVYIFNPNVYYTKTFVQHENRLSIVFPIFATHISIRLDFWLKRTFYQLAADKNDRVPFLEHNREMKEIGRASNMGCVEVCLGDKLLPMECVSICGFCGVVTTPSPLILHSYSQLEATCRTTRPNTHTNRKT